MFKAFQPHRRDAIVVPTGTSGRQWRDFGTNEKRDLTLGGAMGQTTAAALGVALALPNEKVVLFDSVGGSGGRCGVGPRPFVIYRGNSGLPEGSQPECLWAGRRGMTPRQQGLTIDGPTGTAPYRVWFRAWLASVKPTTGPVAERAWKRWMMASSVLSVPLWFLSLQRACIEGILVGSVKR